MQVTFGEIRPGPEGGRGGRPPRAPGTKGPPPMDVCLCVLRWPAVTCTEKNKRPCRPKILRTEAKITRPCSENSSDAAHSDASVTTSPTRHDGGGFSGCVFALSPHGSRHALAGSVVVVTSSLGDVTARTTADDRVHMWPAKLQPEIWRCPITDPYAERLGADFLEGTYPSDFTRIIKKKDYKQ